MPQSLSNVLIHLVFSTKEREPLVTPAIEPEVHAYMASLFNDFGCNSLLINGTSDHVHSLFVLSRTATIADTVGHVKSNSSKWMKTKGSRLSNFNWKSGYGAFSVGQTDRDRIKNYILTQKTHHERLSFQDEFREMLKRAGIEIEERYVWD